MFTGFIEITSSCTYPLHTALCWWNEQDSSTYVTQLNNVDWINRHGVCGSGYMAMADLLQVKLCQDKGRQRLLLYCTPYSPARLHGTVLYIIQPSSRPHGTVLCIIQPSSRLHGTVLHIIQPSSRLHGTVLYIIQPSSRPHGTVLYTIQPRGFMVLYCTPYSPALGLMVLYCTPYSPEASWYCTVHHTAQPGWAAGLLARINY